MGCPRVSGVIFDVFRRFCHILTSGGRLQARAGSVDTNLTRRIDPQAPKAWEVPKRKNQGFTKCNLWIFKVGRFLRIRKYTFFNEISYGSSSQTEKGKRLVNGSSSLDLEASKCDLTCVLPVKSNFWLKNNFSC